MGVLVEATEMLAALKYRENTEDTIQSVMLELDTNEGKQFA